MAGGFDALGLLPGLVRAVDEMNWILPTDVQDEAIPLMLGGGDVMVASETGSGKTAAFCLPIIQSVHERWRSNLSACAQNDEHHDQFAMQFDVNSKDTLLQVDDLRCSSSGKFWAGARGTHGVQSGQHYFEVKITGNGIARVGWADRSASLELGKDAFGFGYGGTGKKVTGNKYEDYGEAFNNGDVIGCYLDLARGEIAYSKNGYDLPVAFSHINPKLVLYPAILLKDCSLEANFGSMPFVSNCRGFPALNDAGAHIHHPPVANTTSSGPVALIIEPTKELAEQVYTTFIELAKYMEPPVTAVLVTGGTGKDKQLQNAITSGVDVVIGTPGKLDDLFKRHVLTLSNMQYFVLDEADRMCEKEFLDIVEKFYRACPKRDSGVYRLQVCFFSATLHSPAITEFAAKLCVNPTWVDLKGKDAVPECVHHVVHRVDPVKDVAAMHAAGYPALDDGVHINVKSLSPADKASHNIKLLKHYALRKIIDKFDMSQCIIFCRTNVDCDNLEKFLQLCSGNTKHTKYQGKVETGKEDRYSCCVLAGLRAEAERKRNLQAFHEGDVRFLICTDVAARGIDIKNLPYVVNMTLPEDTEHYIHRIGRVGRADKMGLAISIVASDGAKERVWWHTCPSKGRGGDCNRRQLLSEGGCTKWYDEGDLLHQVEKRLDMIIPELKSDFSLPDAVLELGAVYGEESNMKEENMTVSVHLEKLAGDVANLNTLELQAQNLFHQMLSGRT